MVLQDPKFSLNPVMSIGDQIVETLRAHSQVSAREARARALAALEAVHIDDPDRVYGLYPHEVSGGMGQRAMIAMMLIADPDLLIADEPTSALDVTVQLQVLAILDELVVRRAAWASSSCRTTCGSCRRSATGFSSCTPAASWRKSRPATSPPPRTRTRAGSSIACRAWARTAIRCPRSIAGRSGRSERRARE